MAKYAPPAGYILDKKTGLYYTQITAVDEAGNKSQVVTWFNADTGEYKQIIYPMAEGSAKPPVKKEKAKDTPKKKPAKPAAKAKKEKKQRTSVNINPKNKFIICSVGALILVFLIGTAIGFFGKKNELKAVAKAEAKAQEAFEEQQAPVVAKVEQKAVVSEESEKIEEQQPAEEPMPTPGPEPEEVLPEETDSFEESTEFNAAPDYEDISDNERMSINTIFASLTGKTFYNGEGSGGFTIEEADNGGIYVLSMFYQNMNEDGTPKPEYFKTEPMGSKVLYDGAAFQTTVYCDGYHITFTYHPEIDGMDVELEAVDESLFTADKNLLPRGDYYIY